MRLVEIGRDGTLSLTKDLVGDDEIPAYAVLSHTWHDQEVLFADFIDDTRKRKAGYDKIRFCAQQAERDGLRYFWVDTCCINNSNSSEISEAINSIYRWYQAAAKCYVYLADISTPGISVEKRQADTGYNDYAWVKAFQESRWFTRGWTLQELLAPRDVDFFSREGHRLGDKYSLERYIQETTGIPLSALQGLPLSNFTVDERFSWMRNRQTTRSEDKAYSLLGIFGVFMPLLYGEGEQNAFNRLRREIARSVQTFAREQSFRTLDVFRYTPLDELELRIIVLHPGIQGEDLSIRLEKDNLARPRKYQALSYVWGPEPALHPVRINGNEKIFIKPNLFQALQRMRHSQMTLHLWVDSLCIDQSNKQERNLQVQRMGNIFREAQNVCIWLGEEHSNSASAMDLIPEMAHSKFSWKGSWWNHRGLLAFNGLLGRPWFQRGWVLQEAAFSANSIVFCGDRQINWRDLNTSAALIRYYLDIALSSHSSADMPSRLRSLLDNFQESPASRLFDIISTVFQKREDGSIIKQLTMETLVGLGIYFDTTDPRDSIYALINLANDVGTAPLSDATSTIIPDYRKGTLDVFADFVLHCCRGSGSLDVICRPWAPPPSPETYILPKDRPSDDTQEFHAPSWIRTRDELPFGNPSQGSKHRLHCTSLVKDSQMRLYNAHYSTSPRIDIVSFSQNGAWYPSLRAKGIVTGEVVQLSTRMANAIITKSCLDLLQTTSHGRPIDRSLSSEIIWRILCADSPSRGGSHIGSDAEVLQRLRKGFELNICGGPTAVLPDIDIEELLESRLPREMREYLELVRDTVWNRRTFRGKRADESLDPLIGLVPRNTRAGDKLCILYGCSVPVVLREHQQKTDDHHWQLVGEAYIHGFMDGEGISAMSPTQLASIEIDFVIR